MSSNPTSTSNLWFFQDGASLTLPSASSNAGQMFALIDANPNGGGMSLTMSGSGGDTFIGDGATSAQTSVSCASNACSGARVSPKSTFQVVSDGAGGHWAIVSAI